MAPVGDNCPSCTRVLITSYFDAAFRMPGGDERLCFGLPASLCLECQQLYIDPDLIELLDVPTGRCTFAIQSDLVLREAHSGADSPA